MTKPSFLGAKVFAKKNWENGPKLGFEFIEKFSLQFILNLFYNENLHCFILRVSAQIPYLEKFGFLRYGPLCFQPIRLHGFLINLRKNV